MGSAGQAGELDKSGRADHNVVRSEEEEGIRNSVASNQELQQGGDLGSTQLENPLNPVIVPQDKEESPKSNGQTDDPIVTKSPLLTDVSLIEVAIKPASGVDKNCHRKKISVPRKPRLTKQAVVEGMQVDKGGVSSSKVGEKVSLKRGCGSLQEDEWALGAQLSNPSDPAPEKQFKKSVKAFQSRTLNLLVHSS
ncbi:hypothetical protein STAS_32264 [Striga asiatica]|uniref:Uncharacterized protein n=1 Tax=Striga asiatica TaxID=4170 RepID=A0A5A7RB06_STRAF|nr:hypothetical protein STAS_32264 [Striga asiatica]